MKLFICSPGTIRVPVLQSLTFDLNRTIGLIKHHFLLSVFSLSFVTFPLGISSHFGIKVSQRLFTNIK